MSDETRNIRYRILADSSQLDAELKQSGERIAAYDQKMQQLGKANRVDSALARDELAQNKLASQNRIELLEQEQRRAHLVYAEMAQERVAQAEAAGEIETALLKASSEKKLASMRKEEAYRKKLYETEKAELKGLESEVKNLIKVKEAAAKALGQASGAERRFTGHAAMGDETAQAALAKATLARQQAQAAYEVAINEAAEAEKRKAYLETSTVEKAAQLDATGKKIKLYETEAAAGIAESKKMTAIRVADAKFSTEMEMRYYIEASQQEIDALQLVQREEALMKANVLAHTNDIERGFNRQVQGIRSLGQAITNLGQTMSRTGIMMSLFVTAPIAGLAKLGFEFDAMRENQTNAFTALIGNADDAKRIMKELYDFAKPTAFEFQNVIESAARLKNIGIKEENLLPILKRVAALSAIAQAGGKDPTAVIKQTTEVIAKIQARGNVTKQQLTTLNNLIGFSDEYLKRLGKENATNKDREALYKAISKRQIDSASVLNVLFDVVDKKAAGLLEKQAKTFDGLISNMKDTLKQGLGDALLPLFEDIKTFITWLIPKVDHILKQFNEMNPKLKELVYITLGLAAALGPVLVIVGHLMSMFGGLVTGFALLKAASGALGTEVAAEGVSVLAGAFTAAKGALVGFVEGFWAFLGGIPAAISGAASAVVEFFGIVITGFTGMAAFIAENGILAFLAGIAGDIAALGSSAIAGLSAAGAAVSSFALSVAYVAVPFIAVAATIAAFVQSTIAYWAQIKEGFTAAWNFIVGWFSTNVAPALAEVGGGIWETIKESYTAFQTFIQEQFGVVITWFQVNWPIIKEAATNALNGILAVVKLVVGAILVWWKDVGPAIIAFVSGAWETLKAIIGGALTIILDIFGVFAAILAGDWDAFWTKLGKLTRDFGIVVKNILTALFLWIGETIEKLVIGAVKFLIDLPAYIGQAIRSGMDAMIAAVTGAEGNMFTAFKRLAGRAWEGFKAGVTGASLEEKRMGLGVDYGTDAAHQAEVTDYGQTNPVTYGTPSQASGTLDQTIGQGKTGYEGADMPELPAGGGAGSGGRGAASMKNAADSAAIAINKLTAEVKKLNVEMGFTNAETFIQFNANWANFETLAQKTQAAFKESKSTVTDYYHAHSDGANALARSREQMMQFAHAATFMGYGDLSKAVSDSAVKMEEDAKNFQEKFVNTWKVGTAGRKKAEADFVEYQAILRTRHLANVAKALEVEFQYERSFQRKIADMKLENTERDGEKQRLATERGLSDEEDIIRKHYGGSFFGQAQAAFKIADLRKATTESYLRWQANTERDFLRAQEDAAIASTADTYSAEKVAVTRSIEDYDKLWRGKLITDKTSAAERGLIESQLAQHATDVWAAFYKKDEDHQRELAKAKRDQANSLIYDDLKRSQAEAKAVMQDAYDAEWNRVSHDMYGVVQATLAAADAVNQYNEKVKKTLENNIRAALTTPENRYDVAKQKEISAAIEEAVPIMLEYGLSLDFVQKAMGGINLTSSTLIDQIHKIQEAMAKNKGVKQAKKDYEGLRKSYKDQLKDLFSLESVLGRLGNAVESAFRDWASGAETFGAAMKKAMIGAFADIASAAGDLFIKIGLADIGAQHYTKGFAELAAGFALKALAGILGGIAGKSASNAGGGATSSAGSAASDQANNQNQDPRGTPFNTTGPQVIIVKFDTGNMHRGMKTMFKDASAKAANSAARRHRQQYKDALG